MGQITHYLACLSLEQQPEVLYIYIYIYITYIERLLKAVILNPDSNPIKINRKLDLLTQLMERAELRKELVEIFINFSDFDVLLGRYAIKLNDSINSAKQLVYYKYNIYSYLG